MTLEEMKRIHVTEIDPDTVVESATIVINPDLPKDERMIDVARQMNGNPYFFKYNGIIVKISHAETPITLEQRLEDYLRTV